MTTLFTLPESDTGVGKWVSFIPDAHRIFELSSSGQHKFRCPDHVIGIEVVDFITCTKYSRRVFIELYTNTIKGKVL
jgi:hypothetical protein